MPPSCEEGGGKRVGQLCKKKKGGDHHFGGGPADIPLQRGRKKKAVLGICDPQGSEKRGGGKGTSVAGRKTLRPVLGVKGGRHQGVTRWQERKREGEGGSRGSISKILKRFRARAGSQFQGGGEGQRSGHGREGKKKGGGEKRFMFSDIRAPADAKEGGGEMVGGPAQHEQGGGKNKGLLPAVCGGGALFEERKKKSEKMSREGKKKKKNARSC